MQTQERKKPNKQKAEAKQSEKRKAKATTKNKCTKTKKMHRPRRFLLLLIKHVSNFLNKKYFFKKKVKKKYTKP